MSDQPPEGQDPDTPAANTAGGKARATHMPYHDEERLGDETPFYRRWALPLLLVLIVVGVGALFFLLWGDDDDAPSTTTSTSITTTSTTTTTAPPTTVDDLDPGEPCTSDEVASVPDCIDPEGDDTSLYLPGGADCLATAEDPLDCADNDGDGRPGPPLGNTT
jgi:hypothetical protein